LTFVRDPDFPDADTGCFRKVQASSYGSNGTYYARVLYSGQPIETIHGTLDWIPLSQLYSILQPFVPADIIAMCNA